MEFQSRDIDLETFVRQYALMIFDHRALQLGLLLASGDSMKEALLLSCHNDVALIGPAIDELQRVGFLREKKS